MRFLPAVEMTPYPVKGMIAWDFAILLWEIAKLPSASTLYGICTSNFENSDELYPPMT